MRRKESKKRGEIIDKREERRKREDMRYNKEKLKTET